MKRMAMISGKTQKRQNWTIWLSPIIHRFKIINGDASSGYKKMCDHLIFDVRHDDWHKVRLVTGGHLTDPNTEIVYSGLISLCGARHIVLLLEL
jgi:hypothetical protein